MARPGSTLDPAAFSLQQQTVLANTASMRRRRPEEEEDEGGGRAPASSGVKTDTVLPRQNSHYVEGLGIMPSSYNQQMIRDMRKMYSINPYPHGS